MGVVKVNRKGEGLTPVVKFLVQTRKTPTSSTLKYVASIVVETDELDRAIEVVAQALTKEFGHREVKK